MEEVTIQSNRGINLSAVFYQNQTDKAIIICHGFTSNKDRARLVQNAEKLHEAGFSVIRFDFGGCGESESAPILVEGQVQDLQGVMLYLKGEGFKEFALVAESLGALVALKSFNDKVETMVLWVPVTDKKDSTLEKFIIKKNETVSEHNEEFVVHKKGGREHTIPKEYFDERQNVDQEDMCKKVTCPVLIIHGNQDKTVPLGMSKRAIKYFSKESKLEVIDGMDHKLTGFEDKVIELTKNWFKEHF